MDTFGINWNYLFVQFGICIGIVLLLALIVALFRFKQPPKLFRIAIGLVTVCVTLYIVFLLISGVVVIVYCMKIPSAGFDLVYGFYNRLLPINRVAFYLMVLLMIYSLFHIFKSPAHQSNRRVPYALALLIIPFIVIPVYYFQFIRKDEYQKPA